MVKRYLFLLIFLGLSTVSSFAQSKSETEALVLKATRLIYNLEFSKSDSIIKILEPNYSNHPGLYLLKALNLTWKNWPLSSDNPSFESAISYASKATNLSDSLLDINKEDPEAIFMALSSHGLLAQYYSDDGAYIKALGASRNAYRFIKQGMEHKDEFSEFYFSSGLYDFYVEQYPDSHPIVRPLMWFFKSGDKEGGIKDLEYAAKHAGISQVEARIYLTYIYLRYTEKKSKALEHATYLVENYPRNLFFRSLYAEVLAANGKFDLISSESDLLKKSDVKIYKYSGNLFEALVFEKHNKDYNKAEERYSEFVTNIKSKNKQVEDYVAIAYNGLARIYQQKGNKDQAKKYAKLASKHAYYDHTEEENERILDSL